ncbi:FCD domain-containing protein, partial [Pseudomonas aeruginosa]|uniref:FCD domain-containing protein n=1 Tax=Pseudomonas aeruginosa TaxID=287 RepID=UPI003CC655BC
ACDQHDQIVQAIQRRDPDAAADIVRPHFELSRRRMAEYAAPAGVEVALVYVG